MPRPSLGSAPLLLAGLVLAGPVLLAGLVLLVVAAIAIRAVAPDRLPAATRWFRR